MYNLSTKELNMVVSNVTIKQLQKKTSTNMYYLSMCNIIIKQLLKATFTDMLNLSIMELNIFMNGNFSQYMQLEKWLNYGSLKYFPKFPGTDGSTHIINTPHKLGLT